MTYDKDEMLPCRECGAPGEIAWFPEEGAPNATPLWLCTQNAYYRGGKCPDGNAYFSAANWNNGRPPIEAPSDIGLVERLRAPLVFGSIIAPETRRELELATRERSEAADALIAKQAEIDGLREVLRPFADLADYIATEKPDYNRDVMEVQIENWPYTLSVGWLRQARKALGTHNQSDGINSSGDR